MPTERPKLRRYYQVDPDTGNVRIGMRNEPGAFSSWTELAVTSLAAIVWAGPWAVGLVAIVRWVF